jgi:hypothetical protein
MTSKKVLLLSLKANIVSRDTIVKKDYPTIKDLFNPNNELMIVDLLLAEMTISREVEEALATGVLAPMKTSMLMLKMLLMKKLLIM